MSKHTPGPWTYHICRDTSTARIEAKGGCEVVGSTVGYSSEECEANAKLIAAAPDLLEALERMVECCDLFPLADYHIQAKAAIAEARGENK